MLPTARKDSTPKPSLMPGTALGDYEVVGWLASGGMGAVYRARCRSTGEDAALKVLLPELVADKRFVARFKREVDLAARVSHPHLVGTQVPFQHEGMLVLPMELLEGDTLAVHFERRGCLSPEETVGLLVPCCRAIHAVHLAGVIHRDLKPLNIFLASVHGVLVPKVLDFGAARELTDTEHTQVGQVIGSRHYMAPEQALGQRDLDERVDVYAMGAIAYQALSGRRPIETSHTRLTVLVPTVPAALADVVHAALAVRESRIATAAALADAMQAAVHLATSEETVLLEQSGVRPSERERAGTTALVDVGDEVTTLEAVDGGDLIEPILTLEDEGSDEQPSMADVPAFETPPAVVLTSSRPSRRWLPFVLTAVVVALTAGWGLARMAWRPTPPGGDERRTVPEQSSQTRRTPQTAVNASVDSTFSEPREVEPAPSSRPLDSPSRVDTRTATDDAHPASRTAERRDHTRRTEGALRRARRGAPAPAPEPASTPPLPCGGNTVRPCID